MFTLSLPIAIFGQSSDTIPLTNMLEGRYAIGLSATGRLAVARFELGVEQNYWSAYGFGVSALRFRHERLFWTAGLGFLGAQATLKPGPDLRFIMNEATGEFGVVDVGTKTTVIKHQYITVPISVNHLLLTRAGTNIYISGGVIFDWLIRDKREVDSSYDGRFDIVRRDGTFESVSITLRGGVGLYQPLSSNLLLMVGPSYGYSFLSKAEAEDTPLRHDPSYLLDLKVLYRIPRR